ncbi:DEAD/DEAH box helicase [Photobacterium carnosum]|uniref:DEAD/DEAH box helicase n=1 Tax=Photobacterium carnosum TaxID=2023717 RepID=UPI001E646E4B|nr:DEAD/DEAH box helicase family protein [Photobacterium carnosum]MCD9548662.1 DEAD/DEAH box helicase [Photobacterium carnosum]MCF2305018.1 DEAD/DEAH box helicase [Photobacterium carnosum]
MANAFQAIQPNILQNNQLREPQIKSFEALEKFHSTLLSSTQREAGIVLPVGCGKSGCITITPFAFKSKRTLVIAPGVAIAEQLHKDFEPLTSFYKKCRILSTEYPEAVEIRGKATNIDDLIESDVVITNIQQLQGSNNKWLEKLESDFFDLIIFDEGHHSVAQTWSALKERFPSAAIVNYSATPERSDGQIMTGEVIYSFPIAEAIKKGYVKELKGVVLNPNTLSFVRREGEKEIQVSLDEVIRLGEEDASFRRSIVTSKHSLDTIVDASITQLLQRREHTKEPKLKIIASALNYDHCIQVVEAYRERGLKADYVHSKLDGKSNEKVMQQLHNHELDVIVQVRKLNEGFDHPFLSVAAVFSVFSNLSPFVQFVGRIMRVITQNEPDNPLNKGIVVFHAGSNIANRWSDFKTFSTADQEYYNQLLPLEAYPINTDPNSTEVNIIKPRIFDENTIQINSQSDVHISELNLIDDPKALEALKYLESIGLTGDIETLLQSIPVSKVKKRQAKRASLPDKVKTAAIRILKANDINPNTKNLDKSFRSNNMVYTICLINKKINSLIGRPSGTRDEWNIDDLTKVDEAFNSILSEVEKDILNG